MTKRYRSAVARANRPEVRRGVAGHDDNATDRVLVRNKPTSEAGFGTGVTARSVIRLLDEPARIAGGTIQSRDKDMAQPTEAETRDIRGAEIAVVFQDRCPEVARRRAEVEPALTEVEAGHFAARYLPGIGSIESGTA